MNIHQRQGRTCQLLKELQLMRKRVLGSSSNLNLDTKSNLSNLVNFLFIDFRVWTAIYIGLLTKWNLYWENNFCSPSLSFYGSDLGFQKLNEIRTSDISPQLRKLTAIKKTSWVFKNTEPQTYWTLWFLVNILICCIIKRVF